MIGRLKQFTALIVFILTILVCGVAYAATVDATAVNITVTDKSGDVMPFATVTVKGVSKQTGSKGEPAVFNLGKGKYKLSARHILVKNPDGQVVTGKARLQIKKNKPTANVTVKIKHEATTDTTNPVVDLVAPALKDKISASKPVILKVSAQDPESQIALVKAVLDGKTDLGAPQINDKTYTWSKQGFTEGNHEVVYTAWNYAGRSANQISQFTIVPPAGNITGVVRHAGGLVAGATIKVDGSTSNVTTDAKGVYTLPARVGNRTITVASTGLHEQSQKTTVTEDQTTTLNFTLIDDIAPAVPGNLNVVKTNPTTTTQTVSWNAVTDLNGVTYELRRYTGSTLTETKALTGTSATFEALTSDTTYGYSVRALDKVKTPNASAWSTQVNLATQKLPTLTWVTPTANQKIKANVSLKADFAVFGSGNGVKQIDWLLLPSTALGKTNPTTATGSSTLSWDTTSVVNGDYSIKATLTDKEGNLTNSTIAFTVDNPQTSKVKGKVSFGGVGISGVTITSDENTTASTNGSGNYEIVINTLGNRTLTYKASGLTDQTKAVNVPTTEPVVADITMVDEVAPSVPTEVAVVNATPTISKQTVSWKASTDRSGIKEYTISRFVGTTLAETKIATGLSASFTGLEDNKEYGYTVSATDKAATNNKSAASATVLQTTRQKPIVSWLEPAANQSLTGTVTLHTRYTVYSVGAKKLEWINKTNNVVIGSIDTAALSDDLRFDWDTSTTSNGAKTLQAKITDDEGNTAIAELAVTVDNIQFGNLAGQLSDADGVVPNVEAVLKKKSDGAVVGTVLTDAAGNYTFTNVQTGDYNVVFGAEGYVDKTLTKTIGTGDNTLNATLALLPRINGFTNTGRTLAIPADQTILQITGLTVNPNADELLSINGSNVNVYNPKTESFIKSYASVGGAPSFIATDLLGLMVAAYGNATWYNTATSEETPGWNLGYLGLVSMPDGSIISADANKIWRFTNRQKTPATGFDVRPITGSNYSGITATNKSVFTTNSDELLFRLDLEDPTNATNALSTPLGFRVSSVHAISGTRTLLVSEAGSNKLHLLDSRNLQEYALVSGLTPSIFGSVEYGNTLATHRNGNSTKLFISEPVDDKIYTFTAN